MTNKWPHIQLLKKKEYAATEESEGKIRLTQGFQIIAQIVAYCLDKGRLSDPSDNENYDMQSIHYGLQLCICDDN